jgi:hypothetical protein
MIDSKVIKWFILHKNPNIYEFMVKENLFSIFRTIRWSKFAMEISTKIIIINNN